MSTLTDNARIMIAYETAKAARITLFGLHHKVNWDKLYNLSMICDALDWNDINDYFTDEEVQCLKDKLSIPVYCSTCN